MRRKWYLLLLALALALLLLLLLWHRGRENVPVQPEVTEPDTQSQTEPTLSGADFFQPQSLAFGEKLPVMRFRNAAGENVELLTIGGGWKILMYWGSWCPYCEKQLEYLPEFQTFLEETGGFDLILVNKTDESREETIETGERYLQEKGWDAYTRLYDVDLLAYQAYGIKRIPTTIVVDELGYVRAVSSETLDGDEFRQLIRRALTGNADAQLAFLKENMMSEAGGVYTSLRSSAASSPNGRDVLSESMGLMMRCAVKLDDREMFSDCWEYVSSRMQRGGVFAWFVDAEGNQAEANALLDDLRIARALQEANEKWGGYETELQTLAAQLLNKNVYRGGLSSFYDFKQSQSGSSIALAYADFVTLDMLGEIMPDYLSLRESLLDVVQGGFISEAFPLYYSAYDYRTGTYSADSLNTAEALMTLCHLAEAGLAREESLRWLKEALETSTLAARYQLDGTPVAGYEYDSTAVFAIAALIGQYSGDAEIYRAARQAMEHSFIADENSPFSGAFTYREDGGDIRSFDQLVPLLVSCQGREVYFDSNR